MHTHFTTTGFILVSLATLQIGATEVPAPTKVPSPAILLAVTNQKTLGSTQERTGAYLSEISHAYNIFTKAGFRVDFVSPKGGTVPLDGVEVVDEQNAAFLADTEVHNRLQTSLASLAVKPGQYRAIYFAGGHGVMWDFPQDPGLAKLTVSIYEQGGVVGAVCHGPAALVNLKLSNGSYLVNGKKLSCFTNEEEAFIQRSGIVPFPLETRLVERGAIFTKAPILKAHVEVSERLVTGQNPASAAGVAQAMVDILTAIPQSEARP